eukprot:TRINITY_DN4482_c0_g1_i2.p1 TRINITY_DN4482_c0_g1~~TRINITY_DN4482_c0_g1_i2.p1  ORF type:complete len:744 (+),score=166.29 TRINITY_DN4482_c0_g1_i2:86-2233(+)
MGARGAPHNPAPWRQWRRIPQEEEKVTLNGCQLRAPWWDRDHQGIHARLLITTHRMLVLDSLRKAEWGTPPGAGIIAGQWLYLIEDVKESGGSSAEPSLAVRCRDLSVFVIVAPMTQRQKLQEAERLLSKGRAPAAELSCWWLADGETRNYVHPHMGRSPVSAPFRFDVSVEMDRVLPPGSPAWDTFRVTSCNLKFDVCPSYAQQSVVPSRLSDELIRSHARFRSKSRFPIVSWLHSANGACLARCSQPATGVLGKATEMAQGVAGRLLGALGRGESDSPGSPRWDRFGDADEGDRAIIELFVAQQQGSPRRAGKGGREIKLTIADARPPANASANVARGGGVEGAVFKDQGCDVVFLNIDNIHVMRKALGEFRKAVTSELGEPGRAAWTSYGKRMHDAAWYAHLELVIQGSLACARRVLEGESVVVHCSDGWDRTSQLVALASALLDPYYRTIEGFVVMVEKDWLQPGHKFADRNGLRDEQSKKREQDSPVFLQFLECLAHLSTWHPSEFEYTPAFLAEVLEGSHNGHYCNFIGDNVKERQDIAAGIRRPGRCLWRELLSVPQSEREYRRWVSPLWRPGGGPLLASPRPEDFQFQHALYARWRSGLEPDSQPPLTDRLYDELVALRRSGSPVSAAAGAGSSPRRGSGPKSAAPAPAPAAAAAAGAVTWQKGGAAGGYSAPKADPSSCPQPAVLPQRQVRSRPKSPSQADDRALL